MSKRSFLWLMVVVAALVFMVGGCGGGGGGGGGEGSPDPTPTPDDELVIDWQSELVMGQINSLKHTSDGGYIVGGEGAVYKLDYLGNVMWSQTFASFSSSEKWICSVAQTSNGRYIVAMDQYIITLNGNGEILQTKTFSASAEEVVYDVQQAMDGKHIILTTDRVIKLKTDSEAEWELSLGKPAESGSVQQTSDGGFIIADSYKVAKLTNYGNIEWQALAFTTTSERGRARCIYQTFDGGYIAYTTRGIYKLDANGKVKWEKDLISNLDFITSGRIALTEDGGCVVPGTAYDDFWDTDSWRPAIMKFASNGSYEWEKVYSQGGLNVTSILQANDGGYVFAGEISVNNNKQLVIKLKAQ